MASLIELAAEIVASHASTTPMTKEELMEELGQVHNALAALEKGEAPEAAEEESQPVISMRKAFGKKQITCMICGKSMKTLARHLKTAHDMTAREYKKQFGIPSSQSLAAKDYSESRRQMAIDKGLGDKLAAARKAKGKKK